MREYINLVHLYVCFLQSLVIERLNRQIPEELYRERLMSMVDNLELLVDIVSSSLHTLDDDALRELSQTLETLKETLQTAVLVLCSSQKQGGL